MFVYYVCPPVSKPASCCQCVYIYPFCSLFCLSLFNHVFFILMIGSHIMYYRTKSLFAQRTLWLYL